MRDNIMAAPSPMDGPPIFERDLPKGLEDGGGYDMSAKAAAKAMLIVALAATEMAATRDLVLDIDWLMAGV